MNDIINLIMSKFPQFEINSEHDDKFKVFYHHWYNNDIHKLTFGWTDEKLYFIKEFAELSSDIPGLCNDYRQNFNIIIDTNYIVDIINLWINKINHHTYRPIYALLSQNPEFYSKLKLGSFNNLIKSKFPQLDVDYCHGDTLNVNIKNDKYNLRLKFKLKNDNIYLVKENIYPRTDGDVCRGSAVCDIQIEEDQIVYLLNLWLNYGWYAGGEKFVEELLNEHIGPKSARKV